MQRINKNERACSSCDMCEVVGYKVKWRPYKEAHLCEECLYEAEDVVCPICEDKHIIEVDQTRPEDDNFAEEELCECCIDEDWEDIDM